MISRHLFTRDVLWRCDAEGYVSKVRNTKQYHGGGNPFARGSLYRLLKNPLYVGKVAHQGKLYNGQHAAILDRGIWDQAQSLLKENASNHQSRQFVKNPILLAGLLYDDNGNPMSPTHSKKQNRRYRYYVSQAVLQYREGDAGSVLRISAKTIEGLVVQQLKSFWATPAKFHDVIEGMRLPANEQEVLIQRAESLAQDWEGL